MKNLDVMCNASARRKTKVLKAGTLSGLQSVAVRKRAAGPLHVQILFGLSQLWVSNESVKGTKEMLGVVGITPEWLRWF